MCLGNYEDDFIEIRIFSVQDVGLNEVIVCLFWQKLKESAMK